MNHPEIEAGQKYKDDDGEYDILKIWEDEQRGLLVAFFDTTDHLDAYKEAVIVARKHEKKNREVTRTALNMLKELLGLTSVRAQFANTVEQCGVLIVNKPPIEIVAHDLSEIREHELVAGE